MEENKDYKDGKDLGAETRRKVFFQDPINQTTYSPCTTYIARYCGKESKEIFKNS